MDLFVFWVMFFIAVNVFVFKHERNFLPGHISRSYCQLTPCNVSFPRRLRYAETDRGVLCGTNRLRGLRPYEIPGTAMAALFARLILRSSRRTIFSYLLALFGGVTLVLLASTYALKTWG